MAELNTNKARQGRTGRPVLYVLLGGLALALVVFAGLGIYGSVLPDQNINGVQNSDVSAAPATSTETTSSTVSPSQANNSVATPGGTGQP